MKNINYALVEDTRPPLYTAMKYWGKKPHNIWHEYIKNYTGVEGIYLDPFSGSAMSALEAVKAGKRAVAFDINPLTSFLIDVFTTPFKKKSFELALENIIQKVSANINYQKLYNYNSDRNEYIIQHVKWNNGKIYEIGYFGKNHKSRKLGLPEDLDYIDFDFEQKISDWIKKIEFPKHIEISNSFRKLTENKVSSLWTKRNIYVLSLIYELILKVNDKSVQKHLLFGFIQTVHLASKMCIPRSKASNRPFSTSWGRSAYMLPKKQMEMNPLLLFESSCKGKQSVSSSLSSVQKYIGKIPKSKFLSRNDVFSFDDADIVYGIQDINTLADILPAKSVDFILTDPPYGGLVKYLDLSYIWLVWLEKFDSKYKAEFEKEITVKNDNDVNRFEQDLTRGLTNLRTVLKDNGKLVFTFHNKNLQIWNAFLRSIVNSGFEIEKVIHQQNKRSGESNVKDPYGTSSSDFYIRCVKSETQTSTKMDKKDLEEIIVNTTEELIKKRFEPTHFQILFNALLVVFSEKHYNLNNFDAKIKTVLDHYLGSKFILIDGKWWLAGMDFDSNNSKTLSNRVKIFVNKLIKENEKIKKNYIYKKVFMKFPNGMTPDVVFLKKLINNKIKE
ncbi:hypothetical protein HF295_04690 [Hujiaoplasma nucleasis]|uniref:Site-specific DNA-methyltransferase n=1 Tax=Hujiaoplasma nucleasis TaxID=2725268 RepID=A0A7L6N4J0_9MOLU|nr:hypothetical protein [Hujiaoplasma nucleasis]QLY40197.1 hypothetical protein HF295_04690 [Hujiaoplasma nucleasis]